MKIAWFSPLIPEHSDIANYTERLRPALETHFEPRFLAERPTGFEEPGRAKLHPYILGHSLHEVLPSLNLVDLPIYNLGNNPTFFSKTWFLSQSKPGILILHDLKLAHFFEGIYREQLHNQPLYLDIMEEYYGDAGRQAGAAYWRQEVSIDYMAEHYPMTGWAIRNALAIVVHTSHAKNVVSRLTTRPVWQLPLPYDFHAPEKPLAATVAPAEFTPENPARLVIFGYLNVNRRVIEFLEALAEMEEHARFRVDIVGTVFHLPQVRAAVDRLRLHEQVHFHGYVTEEALDAALAAADVAINLRYPTMGEASGSQLRIWDHALPSLVTRTEGYATMPPDTLFFVRPAQEKLDIQSHLRRFLRQPSHFRQTGLRGRRHLLANHSPAGYVADLRRQCEEMDNIRSRYNRLTAATQLARTLPWTPGNSPLFAARTRQYAEEIARLF